MISIALNGFGRIGRNFLRILMLDPDARARIRVVAINVGPGCPENTAHLFKYDTLMGTFPGSVTFSNNYLVIDGIPIMIIAEKDPKVLPWKELNVMWVVDCTGKFTNRNDAEKHITAGAQRVLISAPADNEDCSIIPGVNLHTYNPQKDRIVSLGSCTTNAIVPIIHVITQTMSITTGSMLTVHAYTNTQALLDSESDDLRRARAAALNIIPTSTGADRMIATIFPTLKNAIVTTALRVPIAKVSFIQFNFTTTKEHSAEEINSLFYRAAQTKELSSIIRVIDEPLVSSDFSQSTYSVDIDSLLTRTTGTLATVCGWYDNEWGYSCRLKDFLLYTSKD